MLGLLGLVALGGGGTTADPNDIRVRPGVAQLTWTGFAPTVLVAGTSDVIVSPGVAQMTWTGFAPTVDIAEEDDTPAWVLTSGATAATMDLDFTNNQAWNAAEVSVNDLLSCSRASTAYYTNADGTLTSFSSNVLRYGTNGLLRENAATNMLQRSNEFNNGYWFKARSTITDNVEVAPDGTTTAAKWVAAAETGEHLFGNNANFTILDATRYVYSLYVKPAEYSKIRVVIFGLSNLAVLYDIVNASIISVNGGNTPIVAREVLADGWYRISVSDISNLTGNNVNVMLAKDDNSFNFLGDATSGMYVWGAQFELGMYPTSYIPTTSAAVTRAADVITFDDLSWFDGSTTTIYADWVAANINDAVILGLDAANDKSIVEKTGMSASIAGATVGNTVAAGVRLAAAARLVVNDYAICMNAGTVATDTSETAPGTLAAARIGCDFAGGNGYSGYIKRIAAFNVAVNDAGLQTLTPAPD